MQWTKPRPIAGLLLFKSMSKDARLTIRITSELDAWLTSEGERRGLDKAAFARMVLFERKNGADVPLPSRMPGSDPGIPPEPVERDFLNVASSPPAENVTQPEDFQPDAPAIDVDQLVSGALSDAEAQGLTERREDPQETVMADAGVRAIRRPAPRYAAGSHPAWINNQ